MNLSNTQKLVQNSIEVYNKDRPHLSNSMLTPEQMHQQKQLKIKTYRSKKGSNKNKLVTTSLNN